MHVSWLVRVLLAPVLAGSSILGWPFCFTTDNFSLLASSAFIPTPGP